MLTLDQFGAALASAAERVDVGPTPAPGALRRRVRRRRTTLLSAATAFAVAAAAVAVVATRTPSTQELRTIGPVDPGGGTVAALAGGHWDKLPSPPLERRTGAVMVWAGDRVVLWGGTGLNGAGLADGATYDPATRTWTAMAPAPLAPSAWRQGWWTGAEVVVVTQAQAAAYNPAAGRWRLLPAPPAAVSPVLGSAWTAGELVVVGGTNLATAALDPATGRWRTLAPLPQDSGHHVAGATAVWAGDRLLVWVTWQAPLPENQFAPLGPSGVDLFSLDIRRGAWTELHPSGPEPPGGNAHWSGSEVVFETVGPGGYHPEGGPAASQTPQPVFFTLYRPATNSYRQVPATASNYGAAFWTGRALVRFVSPPSFEAVDPATGARATLTLPPVLACCPEFDFVWAGDQLLGYDAPDGFFRFGP